jgi:hypothetical protein
MELVIFGYQHVSSLKLYDLPQCAILPTLGGEMAKRENKKIA